QILGGGLEAGNRLLPEGDRQAVEPRPGVRWNGKLLWLSVVFWFTSRRANHSPQQSGHAQSPGSRRGSRRRLPLAGDDHVLLRLGLGKRRAGLQEIDRLEFEPRRGALILRPVSCLRRTCRRSA